MPLDLDLFAGKVRKYREQFQESHEQMSASTGIAVERITLLEQGSSLPSGDEILIIADHFQCDYKFFISNERLAAFEQTETLFRRWGNELSPRDRWAIQEFLYLCECEEYLWGELGITSTELEFKKRGTHFKTHGIEAAKQLRNFLGYAPNQLRPNAYADFRRLGLHVFRRRLENSEISGVFVKHPTAGRCVLVNYVEDVHRQHFTVAHEAGHAILDETEDVLVSFTSWNKNDLSEVRANAFASHYLMPPEFLRSIPHPNAWTSDKAAEWALKLRVSTTALAYALHTAKLIPESTVEVIRRTRVPRTEKRDPELSDSLAPRSRDRWEKIMQQGLSPSYVGWCFEAYRQEKISAGRLGEMLRVLPDELPEIALLAGVQLTYGD